MENKYQIIYADPPWNYSGFVLAKGKDRIDYKKKKRAGQIEHHYEGMSIQELKDLTIAPYQIVYADPPWEYGKSSWTLVEGGDYGKNGNAAQKIKNKTNKQEYPTMSIQELKDLSVDPYQIVYADPPWHFNREMDKICKTIVTNNGQKAFSAGRQYNTMSSEDIAALPIKDIVDKEAACFMWTTDHHLPYALDIMKAWGFTYKTIGFIWVKKTVNGKTVKMLAPWTNKGAEICLFGTRGAMTKHLGANNVQQVHEALRREHSRKPDIIRDEIKRMFPDGKRIELFARQQYPGWDAWGNEVEKFTEEENKNNSLF